MSGVDNQEIHSKIFKDVGVTPNDQFPPRTPIEIPPGKKSEEEKATDFLKSLNEADAAHPIEITAQNAHTLKTTVKKK